MSDDEDQVMSGEEEEGEAEAEAPHKAEEPAVEEEEAPPSAQDEPAAGEAGVEDGPGDAQDDSSGLQKSDEEESRENSPDRDEEEDRKSPVRRAADTGPSEAQLAMQKRRDQLIALGSYDEQTAELLEAARIEREREAGEIIALRQKSKRRQQQQQSGLSEDAQEVLDAAREERKIMEDEIRELRERSERRKRERDEEERRLAEQRSIEDARRKAEEEDRKRQKEEAERERKDQRAMKMAEWEKWKNPPTSKRNFVISKKADDASGDDDEEVAEKKSKEQIEAEKRAILQQRLKPLDINGFDSAKLSEKAKELHNLIFRLESEKYDLEKRFKAQQVDMIELADRARSMISIGKQGGLKRKQLKEDESDDIQDRFAGCPSKIEMYSNYERQKDKRSYGERHEVFRGPTFLYPAERIKPQKIVSWGEDGLPVYVDAVEGEDNTDAPKPVALEEGGEE